MDLTDGGADKDANAQGKNHDKYGGQLSIGNYVAKELYQTVVGLVAPLGGAVLGLLIGRKTMPGTSNISPREWESMPEFIRKIPGLKTPPTKQHGYAALGGLMGGSIVATLLLGYGHWKKEKQAQMQVDEITHDVSNIELFKKTDPELKAENDRLWKLMQARDGKPGFADKEGRKPDAGWKESVEAEAALPKEAARS